MHNNIDMMSSSAFTLAFLTFLLGFLIEISGQSSIFDFSVKDVSGKDVSLEQFKTAKAILIVNTASKCGHTYENFRQLTDMHDRLAIRGLVILAFPSGQFGNQEFGTDPEIQNYYHSNFGIAFPLFSKVDVKGPTIHPLFQYLKKNTGYTDIPWNFHKYLVIDGRPARRYAPDIRPLDIEKDIVPYLSPNEDLTEEL